MLYCIRVIVGRENIALDLIENNIKQNNLEIKSVLFIGDLKGYLFLEGELSEVKKAISGVQHVRGIVKNPVDLKEIEKYLETEKPPVEIEFGDIIEVLSGPFKGEKGKVIKIDESKKEITIELLEAAVPIPVTISMNIVRVLEKKKKEGEVVL